MSSTHSGLVMRGLYKVEVAGILSFSCTMHECKCKPLEVLTCVVEGRA